MTSPPTITIASGFSISVPCRCENEQGQETQNRRRRCQDLRPNAADARLFDRIFECLDFLEKTNKLTHVTTVGNMPYSFSDTPVAGPAKVLQTAGFARNCTANSTSM